MRLPPIELGPLQGVQVEPIQAVLANVTEVSEYGLALEDMARP